MTFVRSIYKKAYYHSLNLLLIRKEVRLPSPYRSKRNVFLYFDYEREFSGYDTNIGDGEIREILRMLNERKIVTTWFTVGKLLIKYPDSIADILSYGHEIGSHTYAHIPPFYTANKILERDFEMFHKASSTITTIKGFHSPTGKWSLKQLKYLNTYNYAYDIISCSKRRDCKPHYVITGPGSKNLRMYTCGDDWPLFKRRGKAVETLNYYSELIDNLEPGVVGGIGFHPWVLFSNKNLLKGFNDLLDYLKNQDDVVLNTAQFYADLLRTKDNHHGESP